MNKVIAIDIGDVCLQRNIAQTFHYFGVEPTLQLPPKMIYAIDQYERGIISLRQWLSAMQSVTNSNFTDEEICRGWNLLIGDDMPGMSEFINEMIDAGFRFIFFSDTSDLHFGDICRKLSFAHLITGAILSYEVGAKKPETAMYEAFEANYGTPCCYLDDMPQNIAAGQQQGWFSIQFTDTATMRKEFFSQFKL